MCRHTAIVLCVSRGRGEGGEQGSICSEIVHLKLIVRFAGITDTEDITGGPRSTQVSNNKFIQGF